MCPASAPDPPLPPSPCLSLPAGQIYGMARPVARYIARNEAILHRYANEDVAVGAWLVSKDCCRLPVSGMGSSTLRGWNSCRRGAVAACRHLSGSSTVVEQEGHAWAVVADLRLAVLRLRPSLLWLHPALCCRWDWMCSMTTSAGCAATPSGSARGRCAHVECQGQAGGQGRRAEEGRAVMGLTCLLPRLSTASFAPPGAAQPQGRRVPVPPC